MSRFPLLQQDLGRCVICSDRGALLCPGSPCYNKTLVEVLFVVIEVPCVQVPPAPRP